MRVGEVGCGVGREGRGGRVWGGVRVGEVGCRVGCEGGGGRVWGGVCGWGR